MEELNKIDKKLDIVNKALNLAFKVGIFIGGAVLLFYCWKIDYFPKDISVGDGLLFLLLAIAFGGVYLFFVLSLTSLGILMRPIWHRFQKVFLWLVSIYERISGKTVNYTPFTIEKGGYELFVFAIFGLFFIWSFSLTDLKVLATLVLCIWACALLWSSNQQNSREIGNLKSIENKSDEELSKLKRLNDFQPVLLAVILVIPLLIGGVSGKLLDGAMRLSNVRYDNTVVHIKQPYVKYAEKYGMSGEQSNFGKEFTKFENTSILFNGFGKNIVIEFYDKDGAVKKLIIPSDHVHVI